MKKNIVRRNLRTILVLTLLVTLVFQFPQVIQAEDMVKAKIQGIKGAVFVKKGGGQREFAAFENMLVTQGDWVRTGADSSARIVYEDGNQTVVDANTQINIQRLASTPKGKETSVKLFAGGVWSKIKKMLNVGDSYEVETPTAIMGARGTLYLVNVDENGNVSVDVLEGAVAAGGNADPAGGGTSFLVGTGSSLNVGATGQAGQAPIDIATLVESVSPTVLVDIVNDIVERAQDIEQQTRQALNQTQNQQTALQALQMATQVTELTSLAQQVVQTVQQSPNTQLNQQFQQTLQNNNQSMQTLVQSIQQQSQNAQNVNQQAQQKAEEQGLTQDVIQQTVDNIVNAAVESHGTNPTGGGSDNGNGNSADPANNPTGQTSGGDSSGGGDSGGGTSSVTGNATAAVTSPSANAYVNTLSHITGTAQDTDGGTVSALQLSIKKSGASEYLQNDGSWNTTEYWFNAVTSNAYAAWTCDLTTQQKTGVEELGNVGITLNVKVNDGAAKTLSSLVSFTVDTVKPTARIGTAGCGTIQNGPNTAVYDTGDKILITFEEPVKVSTLMPSSTDLSKLTLPTGAGWGSSPSIQALSPTNGYTDSFEITLGTSPTIAANGSQDITVAVGAAEDKAGNSNTIILTFDMPSLITGYVGNATAAVTSPSTNTYVNTLSCITGTAQDTDGGTVSAVQLSIKKSGVSEYLQNDGSWNTTEYWFNAATSNAYADWTYDLTTQQKNGVEALGNVGITLNVKVNDGSAKTLSNLVSFTVDMVKPTARTGAAGCGTNQDGGANAALYDAGDKILITFEEPVKVSTLMPSSTDLSKLTLPTGAGWGSSPSIQALSPTNGYTDSFEITLGTSPTIAANGNQDITVAVGAAEDRAGNKNTAQLTFDIPSLVVSGNATGTIDTPANSAYVNKITAISGMASDPYEDTITAVQVAVKKGSAASYLQSDGCWGDTIYWFNAASSDGFSNWTWSLTSCQQTGIKESGETELQFSLKVDDGQANELSNVSNVYLDFEPPAVSSVNVEHTGGSSTLAYDPGDVISLTFSEPIRISALFNDCMDLNNFLATNEGSLSGSTIAAVSAVDGYASLVNITLGADACLDPYGNQDIQVAAGAAEDKAGNTNPSELTFNLPPLISEELAFRLQINRVASGSTAVTGMTMPGWNVRVQKSTNWNNWQDWGGVVQAGEDGSFTVSSGTLSYGTGIKVYVSDTESNERGEYYLSVGSSGGGITVDNAYTSYGDTATITGYCLAHSYLALNIEGDNPRYSFSHSDGTFEFEYPSEEAGTELEIMVMNFNHSFTFGMCKIKVLGLEP